MAAGDRVVKLLEQVLSRREQTSSPVRTARVVGRNSDGTLRLQRTDGECVARGGVAPAFAGEVIQEPARSSFARRGTSGVALALEAGSTNTLWVERLEPEVFEAGQAYTVTVLGRGFREGTVFEFLRPNGEINEDLTVTALTFVDEGTFLLDITVAAGARLYRKAPLSYDNPGDPL